MTPKIFVFLVLCYAIVTSFSVAERLPTPEPIPDSSVPTTPISFQQAKILLSLPALTGWELVVPQETGSQQPLKIQRKWVSPNYLAALFFFQQVGWIAAREGHLPDLHLESYRSVRIVLYTHDIGGLADQDFVVAAEINRIPFEL